MRAESDKGAGKGNKVGTVIRAYRVHGSNGETEKWTETDGNV
jgi:hypothetical protein